MAARLGSGGRFKKLVGTLSKRKGVKNAPALAAWIGRKKYGTKGFADITAKGHG